VTLTTDRTFNIRELVHYVGEKSPGTIFFTLFRIENRKADISFSDTYFFLLCNLSFYPFRHSGQIALRLPDYQ
jgi:hypothetical protein